MNNKEKFSNYAESSLKATPALINANQLNEEFIDFLDQLEHIDSASKNITIQNEETLAVAENGYKYISDVLQNLDNKRVIFKAPYYNTVKLIDGYARQIREVLEECKKRYNKKITQFKSIQRAQAKAEEEARLRALEEENKAKKAEQMQIARIEKMIIAKLMGGNWAKKDGTEVVESGCNTVDDCKKLNSMLEANYPGPDKFKYMKEISVATKERLSEKITEVMTTLIANPDAKLDKIKSQAEKEAELNKEAMENLIKEEEDNVKKESEAEIKEAGKGLRAMLKFEITDPDKVHQQFLSPDTNKIKDFIAVHRDKIKQYVKEGKEIPKTEGIRFYIEEKHVSS